MTQTPMDEDQDGAGLLLLAGDAMPRVCTQRIPNIGHCALFGGFAAMLFLLLQLALVMLGLSPVKNSAGTITVSHPMLQIAVLGATYAGTLGAGWLFFPLMWHRPFFDGIQWNWRGARPLATRLLAFGLGLGLTMQVVTYFITPPKQLPIDQFFTTPIAAWVITLFGTIVAPVFEEIAFRGFLLPAFAIGFDWLRMPRTSEGYLEWRSSTELSVPAWTFSAVLTSAFFAMIHAQQVAHLWAVLAALFCLSLLLTWVRIKSQSVAASAMVHAAYNGFIFLLTIIQTDGYRHLERMAR